MSLVLDQIIETESAHIKRLITRIDKHECNDCARDFDCLPCPYNAIIDGCNDMLDALTSIDLSKEA